MLLLRLLRDARDEFQLAIDDTVEAEEEDSTIGGSLVLEDTVENVRIDEDVEDISDVLKDARESAWISRFHFLLEAFGKSNDATEADDESVLGFLFHGIDFLILAGRLCADVRVRSSSKSSSGSSSLSSR